MSFRFLPVLEELKPSIQTSNRDNYFIISVQHLLRSSGSMFEAFLDIGFRPQNIFLTGKIYSTNDENKEKLKEIGINLFDSTKSLDLGHYKEWLTKDVQKMWEELHKKLKRGSKVIILDDGGYTLKNIPDKILSHFPVYGVEQTTSGIKVLGASDSLPVIQLAASAAKTIIEPPIVSEAVRLRIGKIIEGLSPQKIGVVGYGHVGKALVKEFRKKYSLIVHDRKETAPTCLSADVEYANSLNALYNQSDVIIGATGEDISKLSWLKKSTGDKTLISVSSGDVEFNKILRNCKPYLLEELESPLQVLKLKTEQGHALNILRGGMVANFTGEADSSPGHIIQVTRGLLFSAIIQILTQEEALACSSGAIMLDPHLQSKVVNLWFQNQPQRKSDYSEEVLEGFQDIQWIKKHSSGQFLEKTVSEFSTHKF